MALFIAEAENKEPVLMGLKRSYNNCPRKQVQDAVKERACFRELRNALTVVRFIHVLMFFGRTVKSLSSKRRFSVELSVF